MKHFIILLLLIVAFPAFAVEPPVPKQFIGNWVPVNSSCKSKIGLRIEIDSVTLFNGSTSNKFGNLDLCYSCEGGVRYSGIVVWLFPEFKKEKRAPFTVALNANEEKGISVIEFQRNDLKKLFPLHNVKLRKCKIKK